MHFKYEAISDVGCVRPGNEDMIVVDSRYIRDEAAAGDCRAFAAVADGMGGTEGGELASDIACQEFEAWCHELRGAPEKRNVEDFVSATHSFINDRGNKLPGFKGMGTTLTGIFCASARWWWLNIGDSRLYRIRGGVLTQLSTDHSMRNLTGDPSQPSNLIYNCLGSGDDFEPFADYGQLDLMPGDSFLICSDGLTDMLSDREIATDFSTKALVDKAKAAGGLDNISLIILHYEND